jgi:hypothetical protein
VKKLALALGIIAATALSASPASALPPSGAPMAVAGAVQEADSLQQIFICRAGRYWCRGYYSGYCCIGEYCGSTRCGGASWRTRRY